MKKILNILWLTSFALLVACGGKEEKKDSGVSYGKPAAVKKVETTPASQRIDLSNKGVGPIKTVSIGTEIDKSMAEHGADVYSKMCTACHKIDKKFIGPAPKGILERRTPEWVMNMILDPEGMVNNDPLAKDLLIEFNGSPMANQGLSEEDARAVLEYFRTL